MTNDAQPDQYTEYLERPLELPPGTERDRLLEELRTWPSANDTADPFTSAKRVLRAADLLWADAHQAPALEDDPIAAMLGLVPDAGYQLDPRAFKRAREASGLQPTAVVAALAKRGWQVTIRDVFTWELKGAPGVPPALLRAAAEVLKVDADRLTRPNTAAARVPTEAARVAVEAAASPRFAELTKRFARLQGLTPKMSGSVLHSRMLATVNRGEHPTAAQMLASLEALVEALEQTEPDQ